MTTEPQCQLCWFIVKTTELELLCAREDGPCLGKIVETTHKCKLFIARADLTRTTRAFVEETKNETRAFDILKMSRHVC